MANEGSAWDPLFFLKTFHPKNQYRSLSHVRERGPPPVQTSLESMLNFKGVFHVDLSLRIQTPPDRVGLRVSIPSPGHRIIGEIPDS